MKFSILVANYNNGHFFKDCYDSILNQTYTNWECIIVDDCSTDNSVQIIKDMIGTDSRFRFYENDRNHGCGYTKRRCAELAKGELCGFVDPDDCIVPDALQIMVDAHVGNPDASLIHSKWKAYDENWNFLYDYQSGKQIQFQDDFFNLCGEITHFATFKKEAYRKTDGIAAHLQRAVDQDLYLKLVEVGSVVLLNEFLYKYRIHEGGISTNTNGEKALFWHWIVIISTAKRRNLNIENLFLEHYIQKKKHDDELVKNEKFRATLKKSRWLKLGFRLGLFKAYKYI